MCIRDSSYLDHVNEYDTDTNPPTTTKVRWYWGNCKSQFRGILACEDETWKMYA